MEVFVAARSSCYVYFHALDYFDKETHAGYHPQGLFRKIKAAACARLPLGCDLTVQRAQNA
ncbi:hypothetical protein BJG93_36085 [Paraburkholderia sprentiae WSM5005]|uniref:Uncharacterized protein n=1 Tax=Paraburkholderia sprentiae WSM5005 TaxID=754502 RepID=A0A8F4QIX2_9BURK|nr:hypothetical protein [Paraburkholderia sprentiae]QXE07245.1 hypothetical protein BJG93_36085 [Paraburkholderia sprentiae WSM5005]